MLKALLTFLVTLVFACLVGCKTTVPVVENQRWSLQKKVQAAEHWKRLANDLVSDLEESGNLTGKTIYVTALGERTDFLDAFSKFVLGALTERGIQVADSSRPGALNLVLTNQLLLHGRRYGYLNMPVSKQRVSFYAESRDKKKWVYVNLPVPTNGTSIFSRVLLGVRNFFTGDDSGQSNERRGELLVSALVYRNDTLIGCRNFAAYIQVTDASLYLTPADWDYFLETEWPKANFIEPKRPSFWSFSPTIHDSYGR